MRPALLAIVIIVVPALSACLGPTDDPDTSPTPTPAENACTGVPAPTWPTQDGTLHGANAYDYMVGLVCDHTGTAPMERARVPGTPGQADGAAFLEGELQKAGWTVRRQAFNGAQYDSIMQDKGGGYAQWWSDCAAADLNRMRGLNFINVEARYGTGSRIVLLLAHWDSKRFADGDPDPAKQTLPVLGANDGASGVGVLLELARAMGKEAPSTAHQYRILLTDGEDGFDDCHPLAGSTFYAESLSATERGLVHGVLLLDMVGDADAQFYRGCGTDQDLGDRIWRVAAQQDVRQFKDELGCNVVDDHTPFEERDMKAVDVIDFRRGSFPPYWHTAGDTPDKISPDVLGSVGRVVQAVLKELPLAA